MGGSSPRWLLYLVAGLGVLVFVYCLWIGKVGFRGGGSVKRTENPVVYWTVMVVLAVMVVYIVNASFR